MASQPRKPAVAQKPVLKPLVYDANAGTPANSQPLRNPSYTRPINRDHTDANQSRQSDTINKEGNVSYQRGSIPTGKKGSK